MERVQLVIQRLEQSSNQPWNCSPTSVKNTAHRALEIVCLTIRKSKTEEPYSRI